MLMRKSGSGQRMSRDVPLTLWHFLDRYIDVRLGRLDRRLQIASVADALHQSQIRLASISVRHADSPDVYVDPDAVALPSFTLAVKAAASPA
jgi:hypothetical protein